MDIPFNLLILPFLGGYIFVRFWNHTRIHVLRSDKDRIVIRAALAGLFSLLMAYVLAILAEAIPCETYRMCYYATWRKVVPFEFAGVSFGAFLIGALSWIPLNFFYFTREREIARAIEEDADPFEALIKKAKDQSLSVAITMTNEKVYVGFVTHQINPATPTNYISILPLRSGFRDPETKQMHLRINYSKAFEEMNHRLDELQAEIETLRTELKQSKEPERVRQIGEELNELFLEWDEIERITNLFVVVIPASQIASVHVYDNDVYNKFFVRAGARAEDGIIPIDAKP